MIKVEAVLSKAALLTSFLNYTITHADRVVVYYHPLYQGVRMKFKVLCLALVLGAATAHAATADAPVVITKPSKTEQVLRFVKDNAYFSAFLVWLATCEKDYAGGFTGWGQGWADPAFLKTLRYFFLVSSVSHLASQFARYALGEAGAPQFDAEIIDFFEGMLAEEQAAAEERCTVEAVSEPVVAEKKS